MLEFPLTKKQIADLTEKDLDTLIVLDQQGLLLGVTEDISTYKTRLLNIESETRVLDVELETKGQIKLFSKIYAQKNNLIPSNIMTESSKDTNAAYNFSINWAPGFFLSKGLGLLTGGCSATSKTGFTFFLIKTAFKNKKKWLWYDRNELLTHELCHTARVPIKDNHFEEFFAYKLSLSRFRRFFGNCFQTQLDAILLLAPIFLLLLMQIINSFFFCNIPMFIFWIIAFIYPLFLVLRNQYYRNHYFKAKKSLTNAFDKKIPFDSILFRCNSREIIQIGKLKNAPTKLKEWINEKATSKLRWKIINKRFIS